MSQLRKSTSQPADLRKEYHAPFAIISHKEGSRYVSLTDRKLNPPRFLDFQDIGTLGWKSPIDKYCRILSLKKFAEMRHHGYRQLMLEFYTTLSFEKDNEFQCRLMGKSVTVTLKKLCDIFGFSEAGHTTVSDDFDHMGFWREIAGDGNFRNGKMVTNLIKDPALLVMCKYISHGVFGKDDSSKVFPKELFFLWCAYTGVPVCTACFVLGAFKSVIRNKRACLGLGNLITAIAIHFGAFDPLVTDMLVLPTRALELKKYLKDYKSDKLATEDDSSSSNADDGEDSDPMANDSSSSSSQADDEEDSDPVTSDDQPAADTWMLISSKLEQMHTQITDGFRAIEARLDGLEKKVNDNAVNTQRKLKDLRKVLKQKATSTASGSRNKGLPNNVDGNTPQPRTSEDDIAHSVKKPLGLVAHARIISGEERLCKATLSPSAAAGDTIIEIYDSDNETKPNRETQISKRALTLDVGENETKISKRNRTERMGKSSPFLKKDMCTLTHDKGKDVLKSSDDGVDFSEDSDDEPLSDSRMEDLVASIRREKCA